MSRYTHRIAAVLLVLAGHSLADDEPFRGIVTSATPEATAAGLAILEQGGNAVDAAVAVSLTLGVTEPAGSGIAGQTVMLIKRKGEPAFVVHGTTWTPRAIPQGATKAQLRIGHTASTVPSTLRVLDLAQRKFGSGKVSWEAALQPAIGAAEKGFIIGPFRDRAFRNYSDSLRANPAAASIFTRADGGNYQAGDRLQQPLLAATLRRLASKGAMDFYTGEIAKEIAADVAANDGWITLTDLREFPEPRIVPAIKGSYRGYDIETLPPPFGGWVVLQIMNVLELSATDVLDDDDDTRRLAVLDALGVGHNSRQREPLASYTDYAQELVRKTSKAEAQALLADYQGETGGETTHFSIVDGDGTAVAVTQSIDSYFGAAVAHPTLGFLYNNYMQGFQVDDPAAAHYLTEKEMPLSSMSATIVSRNDAPRLVLGSPGSARIISAVAQVTSHWIDVAGGVQAAVDAFRVHALPGNKVYVEGPQLSPGLMAGMAQRNLTLVRPAYGVSDSQFDAYFGGVHALAFEDGHWTGAADPRRDGVARAVGNLAAGEQTFRFDGWDGPPVNVHTFVPENATAATPILMVMHGWSREAGRYFDDWRALGAEQGLIVVVPHFPATDFPSSNDYNLGHVFDGDTGELRPRSTWTFTAIESIFDAVVARTGSAQTDYTLFGHSAGSQFVHRFLYYMPDARVRRFIAANAGWYTMPDFDTGYPYGLENAAVSDEQLKAAFAKDVVIMLGREDVDHTDPDLRNTPEAKRQGKNRFARGLTYFAVAKSNAEKLGVALQWRLVVVDDAGHVNAQMAPAAALLVK